MIYYFDSKKMQYKRVDPRWTVGMVVGMSAIVLLSAFRKPDVVTKRDVVRSEMSVTFSQDDFSPDKFKRMLIELNIKHWDVAYAQAVLETGNFKSKIFRENNNLFGMKLSTCRPTTNVGVENGHASFRSWRESVMDYALYYAKYLSRLSRDEYIEYIGRNYAGVGDYIKRLNL